jgi:hypothetical protein
MPRLATRKKELDTRGEQVGQDRVTTIALEGPVNADTDEIQVVEGPHFADQADALAFNEEPLVILIHPSSDKFPEDPVQVAVNGRQCFIWRNKRTLVKRKYVERLARAQIEGVRQNIDDQFKNPEEFNKLYRSSALRYPFSVLEDKSPRGGAWLQKILAEAN